MSLRPPSSPSPSPGPHENSRSAARQSLGPSTRVTPMPASPRTGVRPTSELVVPSSAMYQEVDAMDQWFENLQNYDATLEEMAAASMDVNFKEELSAIEQWFKVLSEAERTAALYSLLQHSTQVQIRFFITVLQAMARADPMTALLSPAVGGSMQNQMEAKLAGLKSPGLKSGLPGSPTTRNFGQSAGAPSNNRQSLVLDNSSNFLSPESAGLAPSSDAASTLAQRRAELKASNASHRISAPVLASSGDNRGPWGGAGQLSQVAEQNAPAADSNGTTSRPKSTEFTGSPRLPPASQEQTITTTESWANMVNTPLIPMFQKKDTKPPAQATEWSSKPTTSAPGVPKMGDPTIHRKRNPDYQQQDESQQGRFRNDAQARNAWGPARSPALNNGNLGGMPLGGFGNLGAMGSPNGLNGMGMVPNMNMGGMNPMTSPFAGLNMNMLSAMGITPEAVLAAQMAASGQFGGQPGWMGMQPPNSGGLRNRNGPPSGRSVGPKSATSVTSVGTSGGTPKDPEDVDPSVLHDIPAWLRSLRLHKYTPNFEHMRWQDMVLMDEAALEAKGVAALGARRKMLKTFELVRKKMGIDGGPPSSLPPSATLRSP